MYSCRRVWQKKHEIPLAYCSFEEVVCEDIRQVGKLSVINLQESLDESEKLYVTGANLYTGHER